MGLLLLYKYVNTNVFMVTDSQKYAAYVSYGLLRWDAVHPGKLLPTFPRQKAVLLLGNVGNQPTTKLQGVTFQKNTVLVPSASKIFYTFSCTKNTTYIIDWGLVPSAHKEGLVTHAEFRQVFEMSTVKSTHSSVTNISEDVYCGGYRRSFNVFP
jgi:hypothetical protein